MECAATRLDLLACAKGCSAGQSQSRHHEAVALRARASTGRIRISPIHYGFVVLPARVRRHVTRPRSEAAVGIVSRFLIGKLRNRRFFSLVEYERRRSRLA